MKVLVLEDEIYAAEKLKSLIYNAELEGANKELDWAQSIEDAKEYIENTAYDLVFSDIELLDGNVFELFKNLKLEVPIIFCTSYNNFYIDAFQTNGIAYLLKPYSKEEFDQAWRKYLNLFKKDEQKKISSEVIQELFRLQQKPKIQYKSSLIARRKTESYIIPIKEITHFAANGEYVKAYDQSSKMHILHTPFGELLAVLNPDVYFQINRGEAINRSFISSFEPYIKSRLSIKLIGHSTSLYTSNSRSSMFKRWIENA